MIVFDIVSQNARLIDLCAFRLKNLRFVDTRTPTMIYQNLRLTQCLKTASINQRLHIALFNEF